MKEYELMLGPLICAIEGIKSELYRKHDLGHLFVWCVEWTEEIKRRLIAAEGK